MVRAHRLHHRLTVLVFDIDNFKYFNDEYGHAAGDDILRETVKLLHSMVRPSDRVCRIGGDEFAVIFDDPRGPRTATSRPPSSVHQIARRFQQAIAEHRFPKLGREAPGRLTISGGLAAYPADGQDVKSLLARADQLALLSKRSGKNCISLGPVGGPKHVRERKPTAVASRSPAPRSSHSRNSESESHNR
jgi:diguanylate cyclase (GGDEF)-like protein